MMMKHIRPQDLVCIVFYIMTTENTSLLHPSCGEVSRLVSEKKGNDEVVAVYLLGCSNHPRLIRNV